MSETEIVNISTVGENRVDVFIDRRSDFGNPFKMKKDGGQYTRKGCVEAYREWFYSDEQEELRQRALDELAGKTLGCWCKPKACHGDVIKEFIEEQQDD